MRYGAQLKSMWGRSYQTPHCSLNSHPREQQEKREMGIEREQVYILGEMLIETVC